MGNFKTVKKEVFDYIRARTPLIIVDSPERERVERMLGDLVLETPAFDILYYTDSKQVTHLRGRSTQDVENDPLRYLLDRFKKARGSIFVLGDIRRVSDDNAYSRELLNILYHAKENDDTLILITADRVWYRLAQFGMVTTLDYPDLDERKAQIQKFILQYRSLYPIDWTEDDVVKAATLLRGFTEIQIENILSTSIISNSGLNRTSIYELTRQKSKLYGSIPNVQLVQVNENLAVSGLDLLKEWLAEKKGIFFASDEALDCRGLSTPKGILLAGVPGCGKSYSARMVAREWELPLFRFDIGSIYDKWVGESEKKMAEALRFIDNVAPCVVWIDEIEKALSVSDSGNDTGKRVLGQFLFWLQESGRRVFLVATANDVALLPSELFRKGRFSEMFFIDLPNPQERREAILQYTRQALHLDFDETQIQRLVVLSRGFSYSDIENAIKNEAQKAVLHGQVIITYEALKDSMNSVVPISLSNPEAIEKSQAWGKSRACPASRYLEES